MESNDKRFAICPPAVWTQPLSENFPSDGPKLRRLVELAWLSPENPKGITLDQWQADLIDCLLERYPDDWHVPELAGRLRYRQALVSVPRQHGKSLLGAILGLYGLLMHESGPYVIGVASSAEQARLIYNRILFTIQSNADLAKRFSKMTETRGIQTRDGSGRYEVKASKSAALQGIPVSLGLFDELHIAKADMWQALVNGQIARTDPLLIGITTAGDDTSKLLIDLYETADKASAGDPALERFGAFIWQASEAIVPDDPQELRAAILESNPAVAEGRLNIENVLADIASMPKPDVLRYRLNRFIGSVNDFIPLDVWRNGAGEIPQLERPVIAFIESEARDWFMVAAAKVIDGKTYVKMIGQFPTNDLATQMQLLEKAYFKTGTPRLWIHRWSLGGLIETASKRGFPVHAAATGDESQASSHLFGLVRHGNLIHDNNALVSMQIRTAKRKNSGTNWKIVSDSGETDALYVYAFAALGAHIASVEPDFDML